MDQMKALDYSINSGWQQARPGARCNLRRLMEQRIENAANNLNEHQPSFYPSNISQEALASPFLKRHHQKIIINQQNTVLKMFSPYLFSGNMPIDHQRSNYSSSSWLIVNFYILLQNENRYNTMLFFIFLSF
jgi:hypothetical protein